MEPVDAAAKGLFMDVPVIIGTTTEETRIYVYEAWGKPMGLLTYSAVLVATDPTEFLAMEKMYPPQNVSDCRDNLVQLATDFIFTCSTRNVTLNMMKFNKSPTFRYVYDHAFSFPGWGKFTFCEHHVCHGSEIPILFHTAELGGYKMTDDEEKLSLQLIDYWTNFAYTSNPSMGPHGIQLQWPVFNAGTESVVYFQTPNTELRSAYRKDYCEFWDTIGYDI